MAITSPARPAPGFSGLWTTPASWVLLGAACVAIDYLTGPTIQFPVVYLLPIALAAWHGGRGWGIALAVLSPLCRFLFRFFWDQPWTVFESSVNAGIRVVVFVSFVWLIDRTARQLRSLQRAQLMEALLGVCSGCNRVHDDHTGTWQGLEAFIATRPRGLQRTLCPDCESHSQAAFDRR